MCERHERKSRRECTDSTRSCMPRTNVGVSFLLPSVLVIELRSLCLCVEHFYPLGHLTTTAPPTKKSFAEGHRKEGSKPKWEIRKIKVWREMHAWGLSCASRKMKSKVAKKLSWVSSTVFMQTHYSNVRRQ